MKYGFDPSKIHAEEEGSDARISSIQQSPDEKSVRKVSLAAAAMKKIESSKTFQSLDAYKIQTRPPTLIGGLVSLLILPATVDYVVVVLLTTLTAPKLSNNNIIWSIYGAPFPMILRCEAVSGCLFSNSNDSFAH